MKIQRKNGKLLMSSNLVCPNYTDMHHFDYSLKPVKGNVYQCTECHQQVTIQPPTLVTDERGQLRMQVEVEPFSF